MRIVAVSTGFNRFVGRVLRLEIGAFTGYLWLINYQIQQQLNNKLIIFTFYINYKNIKNHNIIINIKLYLESYSLNFFKNYRKYFYFKIL